MKLNLSTVFSRPDFGFKMSLLARSIFYYYYYTIQQLYMYHCISPDIKSSLVIFCVCVVPFVNVVAVVVVVVVFLLR